MPSPPLFMFMNPCKKNAKNFHQFCGHRAVDVAVLYMFYKAKTP